jgi:hypothetical protein
MFKAYIKHRAKAFAGALAVGITEAVLRAVETSFDIQIGDETRMLIVGFVTSQAVYWFENGPKEGTA